MLAELGAFRPIKFELRLDEKELVMPAMLVAVGNGPTYGGGLQICPGASIDDGLFDVTVVSAISRIRLLRLFPSVRAGGHVRLPEVLTFRAASGWLNATDVNGCADGESVGPLPLTCAAVGNAVRVLAPGFDQVRGGR